MTIASEITRLQWAKSDIRQAIIDKWVDVCADLTIDNYACCINDIPTGSNDTLVEVLVVWWGWSGWTWGCSYCCIWWWGGWWWVIRCGRYAISNSDVNIWAWWDDNNWKDSWIWELTAKWGWAWGRWYCIQCASSTWRNWWSWWWGWSWSSCGFCSSWWTAIWYLNLWSSWRRWYGTCWWWWGWAWAWWYWDILNNNAQMFWWPWLISDISWTEAEYWRWWDWNWASCWRWYWGWWGWGCCYQYWKWCQGIVIVRYPTECWYNITWWCKYTCWDYTIHCFTQNDFIISEPIDSTYCIWYLVVWWGWNWWCNWWWWGWWWDVKFWVKGTTSTINVVVWWQWWTSCLWTEIVAKWWCNWTYCWWDSWSWNAWGNGTTRYGWGWAWALTKWTSYDYLGWCYVWWNWWFWIRWYWWWWWGAVRWYNNWFWHDWWWDGSYDGDYGTPDPYRWWWGWWYCCGTITCWARWVVDICYPCDWSFWFSTATWWDRCYLCWKICVHRFCTNGTFTITW